MLQYTRKGPASAGAFFYTTLTRSIIITAGGTGKRMGAGQPKQFLLLLGKPVLMHTIERLNAASPGSQLVVTLPETSIDEWKALCEAHDFPVSHTLIPGGEERYHSIKNALAACTGELIAVHDGVRPLVSTATVNRLFSAAAEHPAVIPVMEVRESLRKVDHSASIAVPRADYRIVQTPQVFHAAVLRNAYEQPFSESLTDDASLVEQNGQAIFLVDGNEENIKLTTPPDLALAELLLRMNTL